MSPRDLEGEAFDDLAKDSEARNQWNLARYRGWIQLLLFAVVVVLVLVWIWHLVAPKDLQWLDQAGWLRLTGVLGTIGLVGAVRQVLFLNSPKRR